MKAIHRLALLIAFFCSGLNWLAPYLDSTLHLNLPEWAVTRFHLYTTLPAVLCGLRCWLRQGGSFMRRGAMLATLALLAASLGWTDATELGRGLLKFAGFAVTLPIAALVVEERYAMRSAAAFVAGAALSLPVTMYEEPAAAALRFGTLRDASGAWLSNPNSVGALAGLTAVLILIAALERRRTRLPWMARAAGLAILPVCLYCSLATASRTSFLALAGTVVWMVGMRFRRTPDRLISAALIVVSLAVSLAAFDALAASGVASGAYEQLSERLMADNEGNVATLGSRTLIWKFGLESILAGERWAFGLGVGGVDKALGGFFEFGLFALGRDGVRRLHSHSTYIEWVLMLGFVGVLAPLAVAVQAAWRSLRLDLEQDTVRRSSLVVFAFLFSFGGVINTEVFWVAYGSLLWAELSPPAAARPAGTEVGAA